MPYERNQEQRTEIAYRQDATKWLELAIADLKDEHNPGSFSAADSLASARDAVTRALDRIKKAETACAEARVY